MQLPREQITAILILLAPLSALYFDPIAFARLVRFVPHLGDDTLQTAEPTFGEQLFSVLEGLGITKIWMAVAPQQGLKLLLACDQR
jgi:hypothetical protein